MKNPNASSPLIQTTVKGVELSLKTDSSLFSPRRPDAGTLAMLNCIDFGAEDRVLDLGCGYGLVGIAAAKLIGAENVFMLDVDPVAVRLATLNAERNGVPQVSTTVSDGFREFRETGFTKILSNPPYHSDFSVPRHFILKGFNRLQIGGWMWFVTKREKWYRNKLASIFGGVKVQRVDGYFVLGAEKRKESYSRRA